MNEEKNNTFEENNNQTNTSDMTQTVVKNKKIRGSLADFLMMVANFFLMGELINTLMTGYGYFTWQTTVIYFLFFITATVYIVSKTKKFPPKAIIPGAAALILSLSYALHTTDRPFIILLALVILSGIYCITLTESGIHSFGSYFSVLDIIKCEFLIPVEHLFAPHFAVLRGFVHRKKKDKKEKRKNARLVLTILLGVLFAIPVLCFVVPLLISGDAAFGDMVEKYIEPISRAIRDFFDQFSFDYIDGRGLCYFASLFFSTYVSSVMFSFRHGIAKEKNHDTSRTFVKLRKASTVFISTFLGIICAVYVVYLLSQAAYFFSAFAGHLPSGTKISVTEYARQGFFEMLKVAGVNFCLIAFTVLFAKRKDGKITGVVKAFDIFLCVFTIIISTISVSKILLYINKFGLTEKRVYVLIVDLVMIVALLSVIIRFFAEKFPYMKVIISAVCVALAFTGLVGTNSFIGKVNTDAYLSEKIKFSDINDVCYNYGRFDSVRQLIRIAQSDKELSDAAAYELYNIYEMNCGDGEYSPINSDGTLKKNAQFDNIDVYLGAKALVEAEKFYSASLDLNHAFVYLESDPSEPILSISVSTKNETLTVQNADGTPLESDKYYKFDIDTENVESFTYIIKTTENTYSETYHTNAVSFYLNEDNYWFGTYSYGHLIDETHLKAEIG